MLKFLLFGPPGIGKSTTVRALRDAGVDAYDLEDCSSDKLTYFYHSDHQIYGAADLDPLAFMGDTEVRSILLTLPSDRLYSIRRLHRDRRHPEKAGQEIQTLWNPDGFDFVLYAQDQSIRDLQDYVVSQTHEPVLLIKRGQTSR